jgi:threonine/homoserine/homoserine lactone efflux protein
MDTSFLAFVGISLLIITTPGPDTAVTVRNTLLGHRPAGIATAFGVSIGLMIWALATSAGIVALLVASEKLFFAVKMVGAAYLVWLGIKSLIAAFRSGATLPAKSEGVGVPRLHPTNAFRQGLFSNLSNPKIAAFFSSLLPQFAPQGDGAFMALAGLGLTFSAMTFVWLVLYTLAVATAGDFFRRSRVRRVIEGITGTILIALGIRLATEQR